MKRTIILPIFFIIIVILTVPASAQDDLSKHDSIPEKGKAVIAVEADSVQLKINAPLSFERFRFLRDSVYSRIVTDSAHFDRIIPHQELMNYYHGDFADLLWNISGFYVQDLGSFGKPISASVNGITSGYCVVLYDGIPIQEPELSWLNLNTVSLENIERIEIIKGVPAIINIVPKYSKDEQALTTIKFRSIFSEYQDVGAFFGRKIGNRMMLTLGGSHRETNGEQMNQELSGGYVTNIQQTRYNGNTIFLRLNYLISQRWQAGYAYQTLDEKYDAYGSNRNGDQSPYLFRTSGGLRKDERKDHLLKLDYAGNINFFKTSFGRTLSDRRSLHFNRSIIPDQYQTTLFAWKNQYGQIIGSQNISVGADLNYHTFDTLPGLKRDMYDYSLYFSDQFCIGKSSLIAAISLNNHSRYRYNMNMSASAAVPFKKNCLWQAGGGVTHRYPSLAESLIDSSLLPKSQSVKPEKLIHFYSSVKITNQLGLDQINISGYANQIHNAIVFQPLYFNSDTMKLIATNAGRMNNFGMDLELIRKIYFMTFQIQQSLMTGDETFRHGIPWYRANIIGQAERFFFNKNLHLNAYVSVKYFSRHPGYSFQDAPMMYYPVDRSSKGGWLFNARVMATIGDFKLFYEVENIFRARFTLLDGYDVTPQQWRFGLIWNLYN